LKNRYRGRKFEKMYSKLPSRVEALKLSKQVKK
jgi:hypothetical protein